MFLECSPGAGGGLGQGCRLSSQTAHSGWTDVHIMHCRLEGIWKYMMQLLRSPGLRSPAGRAWKLWAVFPGHLLTDALIRGLLLWFGQHSAAEPRPKARPITCCPTAQHPGLCWPHAQGPGGCRTRTVSSSCLPLGARAGPTCHGPGRPLWRNDPCSCCLVCSMCPLPT